MIIKKCDINELPLIQLVAHQTWPTAYQHIISSAQIEYMLRWMYSLDSLSKQLLAGHHFFLATNEQHQPIGFASYSKVEDTNATIDYHLHKLYVLPDAQGLGIGKALLKVVCNEIPKDQGSWLYLNVNRQNPAVEFYTKNGFQIDKEVDNEIGSGFYMNDYIMKKAI